MFTLRNIKPDEVSTIYELECVIRDQLCDEISLSSFDIGYIQGSHLITIRNVEDLLEVWVNIKKGTNVILWCDGLKKKLTYESRKGTISDSSEDDEKVQEVKKKRKRVRYDDEIGETRKKKKKGKDKDKKYKQRLAFSLKSMVTSLIHLCNIVCGLRCTLVVYIPP